ncbi:phenylacetate-CoA oxygenase subunit PaaC [Paraburkholderia sp. MMS20-SJTN17]|uniref:Phenylacetate-CoA oxygenase subunit PaaC n=1 Tax=Paraburkholderia translucens TaxID=2886945 RepID=A0ABS8KDA0_9BURK|nr:1,2-phenylacetyl-CoA epoxidase subunit PaaC [Paraburkholderia sp. MMS20-SJTN17]MCC8402372.1 phenylacetate-CoA oxygenase subunit PaaC [Paraburkholderia sp. MMS20-SJTN17]
MFTTSTTPPMPEHLQYVLRLADTVLILAQRNTEWCGHGPILEEDIALSNMSLDLIGQARLLYTHAGALEQQLTGHARSEDDYAYLRAEREFVSYTLAELPHYGPLSATAQAQKDYAVTIVRNFLYATLMLHLWRALTGSADAQLAAIAAKSVKETQYHVHHAREWLIRFGDGTDESHRRAQAALDYLMPYTAEFFSADAVEDAIAAAGIGPRTAELEAAWRADVSATLDAATLALPEPVKHVSTGKHGEHSEHLGFVLAEMQSLARQHPGASW